MSNHTRPIVLSPSDLTAEQTRVIDAYVADTHAVNPYSNIARKLIAIAPPDELVWQSDDYWLETICRTYNSRLTAESQRKYLKCIHAFLLWLRLHGPEIESSVSTISKISKIPTLPTVSKIPLTADECTANCVPCAIKLVCGGQEVVLHICNRDAEKMIKLMEDLK